MLAVNILGTAATIFTTKADLQAAVQAYDANSTDAIATYGPIAGWDVSAITDMSALFSGLQFFNADISNWNTSLVTDMGAMFSSASAFNQPLSFDTSSVWYMDSMFTVTRQPLDVPALSAAFACRRRSRYAARVSPGGPRVRWRPL